MWDLKGRKNIDIYHISNANLISRKFLAVDSLKGKKPVLEQIETLKLDIIL